METFTTINDLNPDNEFRSVTVFDGHDRVVATSSDHPTSVGQYKAQFNVYDVMGRLAQQSNPTEVNGPGQPVGDDAAGLVWRYQAYDWDGRPTITTNAELTTTVVSYNGCGCAGGATITTTNEIGKSQKNYHDALGRVVKTELRNAAGSLDSTTTRNYNPRDQVLSMKLYAGAGDGASCPAGGCQETRFDYDGHGRTWKRWQPQYQASSLDPNFTPSSTPYDLYEYFANGDLKKVTDPRGASATYGYNNRGLVISVVYGLATDVANTPNVTFGYDELGNRLWMDDGPGIVNYAYDTMGRTLSETRHFDDISMEYQIDYEYNLAGQLKRVRDPFNSEIYYDYHKDGSLKMVTGSAFAGVTQYINSVSYRAWGGPKTVNYSGTTSAVMGYDVRLRPNHFEMSGIVVNYTLRNDGLVTGLTANDAKLNQGIGHDDFGRVIEALGDGGSEPNQFSQSYGYDAFNNLTSRGGGYWHTVGGPNSYSAVYVNGRLKSATENGVNLQAQHDKSGALIHAFGNQGALLISSAGPFKYDAAGRVTREGGVHPQTNPEHSLFYDGDGKLVKDMRGSGPHVWSVRSSVLGGEILTTVHDAGQQNQTHVYANGQLIATQNKSQSGDRIDFWRRDPHNTLSLGPGAVSMIDPMGVSVSPVTAQQMAQYFQGLFSPPNGGNNPYGMGFGASQVSGVVCKDKGGEGSVGIPVPCNFVLNWRDHDWAEKIEYRVSGGGYNVTRLPNIRKYTTATKTGSKFIGEDGKVIEDNPSSPDGGYATWYEVSWQGRGGQDLPPDDSVKDSFAEFNRDNPGCKDAIDAIAGKKGAFEEAFKKTRWLSASGLSEKEMKNLKLSTFGETGRTKGVSLYNIFVKPEDDIPKDAIAIWTGETPTVITHYQGIAHPSRVVAHETLHILFRGVHTKVAKDLGLGTYDDKDKKSDKRATDAINDYLRNNCNVPRQQ